MWKTIHNEVNYEVSDTGKVRNILTKHIKSLRTSSKGYLRVTLYPNGRTYSVHRLVAFEFCENINNLPTVNHIDGNKQNNNKDNLEWCTPKQNVHHAINTGLMKITDWKGIKNPGGKLDYGLAYSIKFGVLHNLNNTELSKMLLVSEEAIRRIKIGTSWSHVVKI